VTLLKKTFATPVKFILINNDGPSKTVEIGRWTRLFVSAFLIGLPVSLAGLSYEFGMKKGVARAQAAEETLAAEEARERAEALADMAVEAERRLESMTLLLAELQSRVTRLDAVGMNLTQSAGLEPGEFNFDMAPALGGPLMTSQEDARELIPALEGELFALSTALDDREVQLDILSELIQGEQVKSDATPSGRPILSGWLSSRYGTRIDPFSGKKAWHDGVDFAGKAGSNIVAVASGVVSWSGERYGYGKMVEVAHGDGVITRYAHNQENLVKVGDMVRRGDVVALMGNSGRSTGPHVHFEVHKNGRPVDPASYLRSTPN
jgi:murein DD-endopeptidase MepM/ murein hydrolase activator NlpD